MPSCSAASVSDRPNWSRHAMSSVAVIAIGLLRNRPLPRAADVLAVDEAPVVTSSPAPSSPGDMAARPGALVNGSSFLFIDEKLDGSGHRGQGLDTPSDRSRIRGV